MEELMPDGSIRVLPKKEAMTAILTITKGHASENTGESKKPAEATSRPAQADAEAAKLAQQRLGISFPPKK